MRIAGSILLISWLLCWYLCWGRFWRTPPGATHRKSTFRFLSYLTILALLCLSGVLWSGIGSVTKGAWYMYGEAIGFALVAAGQWLMVRARVALRSLSNYDVFFNIATHYTERGVYRYLGHPMYVGLMLALLGSSLVLWNELGALIVLVIIAPLLVGRALIES